jgi:hypothetical protein
MAMSYKIPKVYVDIDRDRTALLGPFVHLWGIDPETLPLPSAPLTELLPFITAVWTEAVYFVEKPIADPTKIVKPWKPTGCKTFPHSNAEVELYERILPKEALVQVCQEHDLDDINRKKLRKEVWVRRRSVHENAKNRGTAEWSEFVHYFKKLHAETEVAITPMVLGTRLVKDWKCEGIELRVCGRTWNQFTMTWEESIHKFPFPLMKRVFPVLQLTAMTYDKDEFLVVQIAIRDKDAVPRNGRAVLAAYTSVERFRQTPLGIEWTMATVADAAGIVPRWVQRKVVPGQIAKDVDMFLGWLATKRDGLVRAD